MQLRYQVSQDLYQTVDQARRKGLGSTVLAGMKSGQFGREHRLQVATDGIKLSYGTYQASLPWGRFSGLEAGEGCLLLLFDGQPLDIIPLSAMAEVGGRERFEDRFLEYGRQHIREGREKQNGTPPTRCLMTMEYEYHRKAYFDDQCEAQRKRFLTRAAWNSKSVLQLLVSLSCIMAIVYQDNPLMNAFLCLVLLLANGVYINAFTPLHRRRMESSMKQSLSFRPSHKAVLYVEEERIQVFGDIHYMDAPVEEILAMKKLRRSVAFYLKNGLTLTVPAPPASRQADYEQLLSLLSDVDFS